jgi:hypothetical protein
VVLEGVLELGGPHVSSSSSWGCSGGTLSLCRSAPSEYEVVAGQLEHEESDK